MAALHVKKPRQSGSQAEPFGIGRVNATHERLHDALESLAAEASRANAPRLSSPSTVPPRNKVFAQQAEFAPGAQDACRDQRPKAPQGPSA